MLVGGEVARPALVIGAVALVLILEALQPGRGGRLRRRRARWRLNLTLGALGFAASRALAFLGPVAAAAWAQSAGLGLFNAIAPPPMLAFVLTMAALDLAVYAQHRALHEHPWLWRLHRVHHTDTTLDVTSAWRFHPLELAASLVWKAAIAGLLGAPPEAVAVYELALALAALFTHADIRLPPGLDRALRLVIATPAVHERHHGVAAADHNANYGSLLTLWDRLFRSWRAPAPSGMDRLGLETVPPKLADALREGLLDPFRQR
jgi:sterol desaturase/sphingolipid hydroxylase (fatty acid hydroxylase superfamily)